MFGHYFFIVMFALQVALTPWMASASRVALQEGASEDQLLVCTGTTYRWISLSASAASGDFVFIDPPVEVPTEGDEHTPTCLLGWLQLNQSLLADLPALALVPISQEYSISAITAPSVALLIAYTSRAPPTSLIA
jgi:hypothetical protein